MNDRSESMAYDELEARLADLATVLSFPPTPDLAAAVGSRLRAQTATTARPRVVPIRRSLPRSLLLAAALALLIVGAAFAVRFGLELLSIEFAPVPTQPPASAGPRTSGVPGASLGLGRPITLDQVDAASRFDVLFPDVLGPPDAVYLGGVELRGQVAFVYVARVELPPSDLLGGAGLLVTQNQGKSDAGLARKVVDSSTATVQSVDVDGAPGVWISGAPHLFWYLAPDGTYVNESRRLVGNTLAWERDGVLYRIEGAVTLDRAVEIAISLR
jgi:hypothetical protein